MRVRVNEIFYSLSGEGISQGIPTVFLRLAGCSLRCGLDGTRKLWCDTGYALSNESGTEMESGKVIEMLFSFSKNPAQILVTGGEPLEGEKKNFVQEIASRIYELRNNSTFQKIRIETNGKESIRGLKYMVFSLDYKLPGSGMEDSMDPDNFVCIKERENPLDEVKFIIRDHIDFDRALAVIEKFELNQNLIFSSVHTELKPEILADWIKDANVRGVRQSLQMHKYLWGDKRGV